MKKIFLQFILYLISNLLQAQTEKFDIAEYKAPQGYTKSVKSNMVSYTKSDENTRSFCIISIYGSVTTSANPQDAFLSQWNYLVVDAFKTENDVQVDTTYELDGRVVTVGEAMIKSGSLSPVAVLTCFSGFGQTSSVLCITNSVSYQNDIETFFQNLTLTKAEDFRPSASPSATANLIPVPAVAFGNTNKLEGVWNGMNINTSDFNYKSTATPIWLVFYSNGKVSNVLPEIITAGSSKSADLGTYSISGNTAGIHWYAGTPETKIIFKNPDQITVQASTGDQNYFRCKTVNGAKLDGSWSTYADPNSASTGSSDPVSLITFSQTGTFTDYGIFCTAIDMFSSAKTMPGSGTYTIRDFCITLKYASGVTRQATITGFLGNDIRVNNSTIYLAGHKLRRKG
ncbi:MAG: hypothetical protein U0V75_11290 [Ferruginibacter sp.]